MITAEQFERIAMLPDRDGEHIELCPVGLRIVVSHDSYYTINHIIAFPDLWSASYPVHLVEQELQRMREELGPS